MYVRMCYRSPSDLRALVRRFSIWSVNRGGSVRREGGQGGKMERARRGEPDPSCLGNKRPGKTPVFLVKSSQGPAEEPRVSFGANRLGEESRKLEASECWFTHNRGPADE